jgi:ribonuclease HI
MAAVSQEFPYGADTEVQHTKRDDGVHVFLFTHHPRLRPAPRPPGRPKSINPAAEVRRLIEMVRSGNFADEAALGDAIGWSARKVADRRREAMAGGLIAPEEWRQRVAFPGLRKLPIVTTERAQSVVEVIRSETFATQTAIGLHLGLSSPDITNLKSQAVEDGLITLKEWDRHMEAARGKATSPPTDRGSDQASGVTPPTPLTPPTPPTPPTQQEQPTTIAPAVGIVIDATGCTPERAQGCLDALRASGWGPAAAPEPLPETAPDGTPVAAPSGPESANTAALDGLEGVPAAPTVLTAHTDGACSGNPGPGGWAVVFSRDGVVIDEASGGCGGWTTNNRAELMAVLEAVRRAPASASLEIVTDSRNVIGWLEGGWKRREPPIAALCREIDAARAARTASAGGSVTFWHVMGHQGDVLNERADKLATGAIRRG